MGFYPVEVLVNDTKRHGVAVLPVDINASVYKTTTEWVGPDGQPPAVVSSGCVVPAAASRERWTPAVTAGWGVRLGLHLVKGIGEQHEALLDAERTRGPYRSLVDVVERTDLPEEVLERLIRSGAMDSLGRPRRELLWQLREVTGASRGRMDGRTVRALGRAAGKRGAAAGRPMDLRLPRHGRARRCRRSPSRSGPATPTRSWGSMPSARSWPCSGRRSTGSAR